MINKTPEQNMSLLPSHIPKYNGFVNASKLSGYALAACTAYDNQKRRCYGKNNPRFKDNGAKGIKVLYSKIDFIAWYLHEIKNYVGKNPSVGRIDHDKSYSFDNIRIESLEDNSLERIQRCGPTKERRPIVIIDYKSGNLIKIVQSAVEAEKETGVSRKHISKYCTGKLCKSKTGFTFKYWSGDESKLYSL